MILWLALPLMWLKTVSPAAKCPLYPDLRRKSYTTGILLEARVVQALLLGQSLTPAIALGGLIRCVLFLRFGGLNHLLVCLLRDQAHPIVDERRQYRIDGGAGRGSIYPKKPSIDTRTVLLFQCRQ